jgi:fatty-acyl-CoA synthase
LDGGLGEVCEADEIGVLTVRGVTVSPGYKNPEQNKGVFIDGLLNSGDLAYRNVDGRIYIAGRVKDLIIRSGHNIDPLMIENAMTTHPAVALAAAVAMPDAYAGEVPVCYVTLRPGAVALEEELHAHAQKTVAERPAWPKHIHIVDAIPLTTVGKIYKPQLRMDAAGRLVKQIVHDKLALPEAKVDVTEEGKRGLRVTVSLPQCSANTAKALENELAAYVFESIVKSG